MVDCLDIAQYFIIKAYEDGMDAEMTNMKVQKLLYYSQCLHLALYNEPLFYHFAVASFVCRVVL